MRTITSYVVTRVQSTKLVPRYIVLHRNLWIEGWDIAISEDALWNLLWFHSDLVTYFSHLQQFFSIQLTLSPTRLVLSGYGVCFGVLLFCFEVQLEFLERRIAASCGFLYNSAFRFMFLLLTASLAWSQHHLFSDITSAALIFVAVINLYVMCRYSEFEETRERLAKEEERAMTQKLRKEAARQALRQVTGTESDWLWKGILNIAHGKKAMLSSAVCHL